MKKHGLPLVDIRIDGGTQPRTEIDTALVSEYAQLMTDGVVLPPVVVFFDGVDNWLADGFHRYHGAKKCGWLDIGAEIHEGTQRDAVLHSVGANAAHGARRTNADKRKAVMTLVNDEEWGAWSNREIARRCGVSHTWVEGLRPPKSSLVESTSEPRTYTTKHGTKATMQTENIGKQRHPEKSKVAVQWRRDTLREMAGGGYSMPQIEATLGIGRDRIIDIAKDIGVDLTQAKVTDRSPRHDSNRIVEHIVMDAENLTADVGLITFSALDGARLGAWIDSLVQSRRSLDSFIRQLAKEHKSHGEAA